jgi:hypothetical protein
MNRHSKIRENERRIRQQQQRVKHRKGKAAARSRPPTPWRPFKKTRAWAGRCRRLLQVSVAEVRRFFVALLWPKVGQLASVLHWSDWAPQPPSPVLSLQNPEGFAPPTTVIRRCVGGPVYEVHRPGLPHTFSNPNKTSGILFGGQSQVNQFSVDLFRHETFRE